MLRISSFPARFRRVAPFWRFALAGLVLLAPGGPAPSPALADEPGRQVVGRIRGTIRDGAERPVPGLLVQLVSRDEAGVLRITGTDERGRYLFRDLPGGYYDVRVAVDGYRDQTKASIEVRPPFQNIVDFLLAPESAPPEGDAGREGGAEPASRPAGTVPDVAVRGTLVDGERRPVTEVSVTIMSLEGVGTYQAFSDTEGRFVLAAVPPGRYRAVITSPGHVTLDLKSVRVPAGSGLDLNLSLVDYPLNFRDGRESLLPPEKPRTAPGPGSPS